MQSPKAEILMSTYNGAKYLHEQIESILCQTYINWKLIIRDDGSTDGSQEIINEYAAKFSEKITVLTDNDGNLGYKKSFLKLLEYSTADYILFADQDDFWFPEKIEKSLQLIIEKEGNYKNIPILVCCDLSICDEDLTIIEKSYYKHLNFNPNFGQQMILLASILHGCAFIFNRKLKEETLRLFDINTKPDDFIIKGHDNLLSVVAAIKGKIFYLNEPLLNHRIHDQNKIGFVKEVQKIDFYMMIKTILKYAFRNRAYRENYYGNKIKENQEIIQKIIDSSNDIIPEEYNVFLNIDQVTRMKRKLINRKKPFVFHHSERAKIIYIICF